MTGELPLLTASRLRDARACQRRHKLKYFDGYRPLEEVSVLRFGTLLHKALEAWWGCEGEERITAALAQIPPEADPFDAATATALMLGYHERWKNEYFEVLAVEHEFRVPLVNPQTGAASRTWQLAGKLDAIASDKLHRVLVVEHKTSSEDVSQGSEYWKRLRMDGQVSVYFQGARAAGYSVEACLYDVIRKPGQRPLKATPEENRKYTKDGRLYANQREADETAPEYLSRLCDAIAEDPSKFYARGEVVRLEAEMDEAMYDVWVTGQQIREAQVAGKFPRNPGACVQYGRTCEFFGVCTGEQSIDDPLLFRRVTNVSPELNQQPTA